MTRLTASGKLGIGLLTTIVLLAAGCGNKDVPHAASVATPQASATVSSTPSYAPSPTLTPTPAAMVTDTPIASPTPMPTLTPTPATAYTPTPQPAHTTQATPTSTPKSTSTATSKSTPKPTPSSKPTTKPSPEPTFKFDRPFEAVFESFKLAYAYEAQNDFDTHFNTGELDKAATYACINLKAGSSSGAVLKGMKSKFNLHTTTAEAILGAAVATYSYCPQYANGYLTPFDKAAIDFKHGTQTNYIYPNGVPPIAAFGYFMKAVCQQMSSGATAAELHTYFFTGDGRPMYLANLGVAYPTRMTTFVLESSKAWCPKYYSTLNSTWIQ